MKFTATKVPGAFEIRPELHEDSRGFFARSWCRMEFQEHGLNPALAQCNISFNNRKGTLRGLHFQATPHEEAKLVRCTRGAVYDVVVDLRPSSPAYKQWIALELTSDNHAMLYVPEGCGHGFLTLEDDTEVFYQMSEFFYPDAGRGFRWDDPAFSIAWPEKVQVISDRDASYPDFK